MPSQYLLAITIGPVQDFIATARRSRDLWFGSWVLSELSKAAAFAICEGKDENLSRLIFPSVQSINDIDPEANSDFNVVNKILAIVADPKAMAVDVGKAVGKRLEKIREDAYRRIPRNGLFYEDRAILQVEDFVELFWAAYPLKDESDYSTAREKVELLLNARKATRNFGSSEKWSSNAPKSSLDGERESVIDDSVYKKLRDGEITRDEFLKYGLRDGERLCGVGLLKRKGNRAGEEGFFSTSHVAALPLLQRLTIVDKEAAQQAVKIYFDKVRALLEKGDALRNAIGHVPEGLENEVFGDHDGHLLFRERLHEFFDKDRLDDAVKALDDFFKEAFKGDESPRAPLPYYALLLADGDNMGKVIDNISEIQIAGLDSDVEKHRKLSEHLSNFARRVSVIVNRKHNGSLVYAGGDDVLAFVPLHTVLQCARELADEFKQELQNFAFSDSDKNYQPTLSVGVVIAHHMESLQDALTLVRGAEKTAKKVEGKEALAIVLSKRSGADTTIKGSWKSGAQNPFDRRLLRFAQLHLTGDIPDGAAYELRELSLRLTCDRKKPECKREYETLQKAMRSEALRILRRKEIKDKNILGELLKDVENISVEQPIEQLADELIVAREFAKAFEQAGLTAGDLNKLLPQATTTGGQA